LGKNVHLNCPSKKHNSVFGLLPIAVTKINKKTTNFKTKPNLLCFEDSGKKSKNCNLKRILTVRDVVKSLGILDDCSRNQKLLDEGARNSGSGSTALVCGARKLTYCRGSMS